MVMLMYYYIVYTVSREFCLVHIAPGVVTLMGRGLNSTVNASAAFCRFKVNSLIIYGKSCTLNSVDNYIMLGCKVLCSS